MPRSRSSERLRTIGEAVGAARALLDSTYEALLDIEPDLANAVADAVDLIDAALDEFSPPSANEVSGRSTQFLP